jgi:hypothetical protein
MKNLAIQVEPRLTGTRSKVVGEEALGFKLLWPEKAPDGPMEMITARFGDDLNNTASGFPVLRLETAGFDIDFFNEGQIDARGK